MTGGFCSVNGRLVPAAEAVVPVDDINFAYGFGVYETLKLRRRVLYFPDYHERRLFNSAEIIGLEHAWKPGDLVGMLRELVAANRREDANLKVLLVGGDGPERSRLYCMCLNPLYPERRDFRDGARALVWPGERIYPQAKTLSMLQSVLAYREARRAGAYDAVFLGRDGTLTEGTRTNLFFTDGERLFTPPAERVLEGVTRMTIIQAAGEAGLAVEERPLPEAGLADYAGFFLSSTSTRIMPLKLLGGHASGIPELVRRLMKLYDDWLERWAAGQAAVF